MRNRKALGPAMIFAVLDRVGSPAENKPVDAAPKDLAPLFEGM
ncbi:hypothetical protein SAMN02745121_05512 [Nannocystis exedens]|uniref:Uncharacterized protein n=1 Tax=Nannocystis exedens TaxID=54 RepID=A0A1I2DBQ5_9BACT|nr:hypothetical protein [Nannocystis exedens]PCC70603.1 hypothetical protein NAEX_03667 [Nannocystis exedens]SFE77992.1 hypothetical protein SAMN02745121_05512 [Nannocystis exedens]